MRACGVRWALSHKWMCASCAPQEGAGGPRGVGGEWCEWWTVDSAVCFLRGKEIIEYLWPVEINQVWGAVGDFKDLVDELEVRQAAAAVRRGGVGEEAEEGVHVGADDVQGLFQALALLFQARVVEAGHVRCRRC